MPAEYSLKLLQVTPRIRRNTVAGALAIVVSACLAYLLVQQLYPGGTTGIVAAMLLLAVGVLVGIVYYLKAVMAPIFESRDGSEPGEYGRYGAACARPAAR